MILRSLRYFALGGSSTSGMFMGCAKHMGELPRTVRLVICCVIASPAAHARTGTLHHLCVFGLICHDCSSGGRSFGSAPAPGSLGGDTAAAVAAVTIASTTPTTGDAFTPKGHGYLDGTLGTVPLRWSVSGWCLVPRLWYIAVACRHAILQDGSSRCSRYPPVGRDASWAIKWPAWILSTRLERQPTSSQRASQLHESHADRSLPTVAVERCGIACDCARRSLGFSFSLVFGKNIGGPPCRTGTRAIS